MQRIHVLSSAVTVNGTRHLVHPVVVEGPDGLVLVDTGYPDQADALLSQITDLGLDPGHLVAVVITHHDYDHIGSLAALKRRLRGMAVLTSEAQAPYLEGRKPPLRIPMYQALEARGNAQEKAFARLMMDRLEAVEPVAVDRMVGDGDMVHGLEIIGTPGHMPGHLSVYLPESRTLVTGDALNVVQGKLSGANPAFTFDPEQAEKSVRRLIEWDVAQIVCYHGGALEGNGNEALRDLISGFGKE